MPFKAFVSICGEPVSFVWHGSMVEMCEQSQVFRLRREDAGFILTDGCAGLFELALSPRQMAILGQELTAMARAHNTKGGTR
jgi:hypothetical protein